MVDLPREHRIEAAPNGEHRLVSVSEDGSELNWRSDIGKHHYTCSCGESFEGRNVEQQILEHLMDVDVLDWDDIDEEAFY